MQALQHTALSELDEVLRRDGVEEGLRWLNRRVAHRATAIYQLKAITVRLQYLFDRQGQVLPKSMTFIPITDSFCQHAIREGYFLSDDTRDDVRVAGSPFQGVVRAYHAVPFPGKDGQLFGTLCHFDFLPRELPEGEFEFMRSASLHFSAYL